MQEILFMTILVFFVVILFLIAQVFFLVMLVNWIEKENDAGDIVSDHTGVLLCDACELEGKGIMIKCPDDLNRFLLGKPTFENTFSEKECEERKFFGDCYHCFTTSIARRDEAI